MTRRIKYMGPADTRTINTGEDWGGRLGTPLSSPVTFSSANNRIVDVEEAGFSEAAVVLLLEDPMFVDVTGAELIPAGLNEQYFQGVPETPFVSRGDGKGNEVSRSVAFTPPEVLHEDLTAEQMSERLQELGLPKSGSKKEMAERLSKAGQSAPQ